MAIDQVCHHVPAELPLRRGQLQRWVAAIALRIRIRRERKELAELPGYLLRDIGVDPQQARIESIRAFNDIPASRLPADR